MKSNKAFTLIELLVVVLIIGILAAIAVPQYQVAVMKSRLSQAFILGKALKEAERVYYLANNEYTTNIDDLDVTGTKCTGNAPTYYCANKTRIDFQINKTAGLFSIYTYIQSVSGTLFLEHHLNTSMCLCGANFEIGKKACQSLGGTFYAESGNLVFYQLP